MLVTLVVLIFFIFILSIDFEFAKLANCVCLIEKIIKALINFTKNFISKTLSRLKRFCISVDKRFRPFFMWLFHIYSKYFLPWLRVVIFDLFSDTTPVGSFIQSFCLYVNQLTSRLFDFFKFSAPAYQSYFSEIKQFFIKLWLTLSAVFCKFKPTLFGVLSIVIQLLKWVVLLIIIVSFYICVVLFCASLGESLTFYSWFVALIIGFLVLYVLAMILNHYRLGKFTDEFQRIWKLASILFLFLELCFYAAYFLYYLTRLSNSWNLNDAETNSNFLLQLNGFSYSAVALVFCLFSCYLLVHAVNFGKVGHTFFFLIGTAVLLMVVLCREAYQIYYLTVFSLSPSFDFIIDPKSWLRTIAKTKKLPPEVEYFLLCPLIRFLHFFFIYINWCSLVWGALMTGRVNYNLLCFNVQNFLMLLFMCLISIFQLLVFYCAWGLSEPSVFFLIMQDHAVVNFFCSILSIVFTTVKFCFSILFGWIDSIYCVFFDVQPEFKNYTVTSNSFSALGVADDDYTILT